MIFGFFNRIRARAKEERNKHQRLQHWEEEKEREENGDVNNDGTESTK